MTRDASPSGGAAPDETVLAAVRTALAAMASPGCGGDVEGSRPFATQGKEAPDLRAVSREPWSFLAPVHDVPRANVAPEVPRVAIGLSGGIDSTVLLHACVRLFGAQRCVALHIHHGLSPHADAWLDHCRRLCNAWRVSFAERRVHVRAAGGESIEAAARDARYAALAELCAVRGAAVLLLGHHADDQAETVLLQLLRGAGLAGLAAMPGISRQLPSAPGCADQEASALPCVRPLLRVLRSIIEAYAARHRLSWVEDESNRDAGYARNALRHHVLPHLARYFPGYRDTLARSAAHLAEGRQLLDELARLDLAKARHASREQALSRAALRRLSRARAANLLRYWIRQQRLPAPSSARLAELLRQLREAAPGAYPVATYAGHALRVYRDAVYWNVQGDDTPRASVRAPLVLLWDAQPAWRMPAWHGTLIFAATTRDDQQGVSAAQLRRAPLSARPRGGGKRLRVAPGAPARTLKNLFQEVGVPPWQRDVPLIYLGEDLLYVPGIGVDRRTAPHGANGTGGWIRLEWRPDVILA